MRAKPLLPLLAAIALLAGCGDDNKATSTTPGTATATTPATGTTAAVPDTVPKGAIGAATANEAVQRYFSALAVRDGTAACKMLSTKVQRQAVVFALTTSKGKIRTCGAALQRIISTLTDKQLRRLRNVEIGRSAVTGGRARVRPKGGTRDARLTRIDGRWYISGGLYD